MRLPDEILDCVIYLYPSVSDAQVGMKAGGSGFLLGVRSEAIANEMHVYAVSNRHVVESAPVVRLNTAAGKTDVICLSTADWEMHDTEDLAIILMSIPDGKFRYNAVDAQTMLDQETIDEYRIGIGDETFLIGRFIKQDGRQSNTPVARTGTIAMMPGEPLFNELPAYLVEIRVIGGFSGSPVFVHVPPLSPRAGKEPELAGYGQWLLGIEVAYPFERSLVIDPKTHKPHANGTWVNANTGMSIVIPASKLQAMIMAPAQRQRRDEEDKRILRERSESGIQPASASVEFGRDEYLAALRKVARRTTPSQSDEASSGT